eukprot:sb/3469981/
METTRVVDLVPEDVVLSGINARSDNITHRSQSSGVLQTFNRQHKDAVREGVVFHNTSYQDSCQPGRVVVSRKEQNGVPKHRVKPRQSTKLIVTGVGDDSTGIVTNSAGSTNSRVAGASRSIILAGPATTGGDAVRIEEVLKEQVRVKGSNVFCQANALTTVLARSANSLTEHVRPSNKAKSSTVQAISSHFVTLPLFTSLFQLFVVSSTRLTKLP